MDDAPVSQIMTSPVVTANPDDRLTDAAATMMDEEVGSLIVVDDDDVPAGILTRTDFVQYMADVDDSVNDAPTIRSVMSTELATIPPEEPLGKVADTMKEYGVHHLPIVDDDGRLEGIVTTTDLSGTWRPYVSAHY